MEKEQKKEVVKKKNTKVSELELLREKYEDVKTRLGIVIEDNTELVKKNEELKRQLSGVKGHNTTLNKSIAALNEKITNLTDVNNGLQDEILAKQKELSEYAACANEQIRLHKKELSERHDKINELFDAVEMHNKKPWWKRIAKIELSV